MCDILIIDDDPQIKDFLSHAKCIEKHGVKRMQNQDILKFASTCEEGITKFKEYMPEFVFLDMMLPGSDRMCGSDVFKKIKEINPDTVVFLMTGYQDDREITNMIKDGIDGYIAKQGNYAALVVSIIISVIKTMCKDD